MDHLIPACTPGALPRRAAAATVTITITDRARRRALAPLALALVAMAGGACADGARSRATPTAVSAAAAEDVPADVPADGDPPSRAHIITRHGKVTTSTCDPEGNCKLSIRGKLYADVRLERAVVRLAGSTEPAFHAVDRTQTVATLKPAAAQYNTVPTQSSAGDLVTALWAALYGQTDGIGVWAMRHSGLSGYAKLFADIQADDSTFAVSSDCPTDLYDSGIAYTFYLLLTPGTKTDWNVDCVLTKEDPAWTPCPADPSACSGIAGQSCGWCVTTGAAYAGTDAGPQPGACGNWIWSSNDCSCAAMTTCSDIEGTSCGWCATTGQAMPGSASGPKVGKCADWIGSSGDCVCAQITDCSGIKDTPCGWCATLGEAMPGDESGPTVGSCADWVGDHNEC